MNRLMPSIVIKKGVCQMLALNKFSVQQWLKSFDTIIFDAEGVLWQHDTEIEGAPQTFNALRAMGKKAYICTNHSATSCAKLAKKAQQMGLLINDNELLSSSMALARYLTERRFRQKVYVIGGQGIRDELKVEGIESVTTTKEDAVLAPTMREHVKHMKLDEDVGAVAVGIDTNFDLLKLTVAACYLQNPRTLLLATNRDLRLPANETRSYPGAGIMVAAVEGATHRTAFTCGKPNTFMLFRLLRDGIIKPDRTLMVGDT